MNVIPKLKGTPGNERCVANAGMAIATALQLPVEGWLRNHSLLENTARH